MKRLEVAAILGGALFATSAQAATCATGAGFYTSEQANAGLAAYSASCASCHNADLLGNSGPALSGAKFASYVGFTKITPTQLLAFTSSQMPANAPGTLSATDYDNIFAYILSYDKYPSGTQPVSADGMSCLSLLPYPGVTN
nr:cytochrome c [uncultured Lichenicoccus sp.]